MGDSDVPAPRLQDSLLLDPWTVYLSKDGTRLDGSTSYVCADEGLGNGPDPGTERRTALSPETKEFAFMTFFDEDMEATTSFEAQLNFLHYQYFPRMHWAKLVLNPAKSYFLIPKTEMLGLQADGNGIRPGNDKLRAFRNYPTPTGEKELDQFEYMTTYLRKFVPGRVDHIRILRKSVIKIPELAAVCTAENAAESNAAKTKAAEMKAAKNQNKAVGNRRMADKRKVKMREIGFKWSEEEEKPFQVVKRSVLANACHGGDPDRQSHLARDASGFAYGGVLFQLAAEHPVGTVMSSKLVGSMRIVQFTSAKKLKVEVYCFFYR